MPLGKRQAPPSKKRVLDILKAHAHASGVTVTALHVHAARVTIEIAISGGPLRRETCERLEAYAAGASHARA